MTAPLPRPPSTASSLSSPLRRPRRLRLLVAATGPRDVSWARALVVRLCKDPTIDMRAIVDDVTPRLSQMVMVLHNGSTSTAMAMDAASRPDHAAASASATAAGSGSANTKSAIGSGSDNTKSTAAAAADVDQDDMAAAACGHATDAEFYHRQAFELADWADMLVLAPLDSDGIAKMLAGFADSLLLELLRGWDPSKRVLLVPGMSTHAWRAGLTERHLSKIRRRWTWIRTLPPILWHWEDDGGSGGGSGGGGGRRVVNWNGFSEVIHIVKNEAELVGLGRGIDMEPGGSSGGGGGGISNGGGVGTPGSGVRGGGGGVGRTPMRTRLPAEIWTMILEITNDWELAQALGIYTILPTPKCWTLQSADPADLIAVYEHELRWTVLTSSGEAVCRKIAQSPAGFEELPATVARLVIRFGLVDVLAYLEANRPCLFRAFDGPMIPTTASARYARPEILEYWKRSPYFRDRHVYNAEPVDGASLNGHVDALEWWRRSGLPMRYTEQALELASAGGHVAVLDWWRDAGSQDDGLVLRPGRSLLHAAQYGRIAALRWWDGSGIPISHSDGVPKMASRWGRVEVLELWRRLRGDDKLVFDEDVLVGPTAHAHIDVLEWWRRFARGELAGMEGRPQRVEYRTCDIEEALEDGIGDQDQVRAWWKANGLDLKLHNMEWMDLRTLWV